MRDVLIAMILLPAMPLALFAQSSKSGVEPLGAALKPHLVAIVPKTLYQKSDNWGHQAMVPVGIKWRGLRPRITESPRNHGEWKRLEITAQDLPRTLHLKIHDVNHVNAEKQTFKVQLEFQMGVRYEQQNWANGARLWSGSVRARAQVKLDMECEQTLKLVLDKNSLPDFVFRLRVTSAKVGYDKLVVEHINGIGGDGAKIIGRAVHDVMKQWRPSIERDLLAKASAAIVKAADTREIRVGFGSLSKRK